MHLSVYFRQQYDLVKGSRELLLSFCGTMPNEDFIRENNGFGIASVRDLLVHIANSYEAWLKRALKKEVGFTPKEKINNIAEVRTYFEKINKLMAGFIDLVEKENPETLVLNRNGKKMESTPLVLFSHVITHEFHHKGQILSLGRHLGYIPIDTDIIL